MALPRIITPPHSPPVCKFVPSSGSELDVKIIGFSAVPAALTLPPGATMNAEAFSTESPEIALITVPGAIVIVWPLLTTYFPLRLIVPDQYSSPVVST